MFPRNIHTHNLGVLMSPRTYIPLFSRYVCFPGTYIPIIWGYVCFPGTYIRLFSRYVCFPVFPRNIHTHDSQARIVEQFYGLKRLSGVHIRSNFHTPRSNTCESLCFSRYFHA